MPTDPAALLKTLKPNHEFFVGIDSDGCAFDTMEIKHKECFIPNTIKHWNLQPVSKFAREAGEFVNLYSKWRGINRWPALLMVFDLLAERPEVQARHTRLPEVPTLRDWARRETKLANPALKAEAQRTGDPILWQALGWSQGVNSSVEDMVKGVPPFPFTRESITRLAEHADIVCVSATPGEALHREWAEHDLARYTRVIAGQEMGTKKEHIAFATRGRYATGHVLMIGDAPGDMAAARANEALFFPINPGQEDKSWQQFYEEGLDRFLAGQFAGPYEANLVEAFEALLPDSPPWKQ